MEDVKKACMDLLEKPMTGTVLTIASGLSFFFLCMILAIVGPAGSRVDHAGKNTAAFLAVLFLTFALAGTATYSKLLRRKGDESPLPYWSMGLGAICVVIFLVKIMGGFAI